MRRYVETDDLVGVTEIAKLCGVRTSAVSNWTLRHADFPEPLVRLKMGAVYEWRNVQEWLRSTGRVVRS